MRLFLLLLIAGQAFSNPIDFTIYTAAGDRDQLPENFQLFDSSQLELGTSYWAKVEIHPDENGNYTLQGGNWYMQCMQFFDDQLNPLCRGNTVTIGLNRNENTTIYIFYPFIDEKEQSGFAMNVERHEDFLETKNAKDLAQTSFISILIFILLVTTFFVITSNDRVYLHYALYILSILIFFSYQFGLLSVVFGFVKDIPPTWFWISSASLSISYIYFAESFLKLKETDPTAYKVTTFGKYFIGGVVLIETLAYLINFDMQHSLIYKGFILAVQVVLMIIITYRVYNLKTVLSNIFMLGLMVLLATTLTGQLLSTFQLTIETSAIIQSGLILEIFIFAIGLSVRVGLLRKERLKAQQDLIEQLQLNDQLHQKYTLELEQTVKERTSALTERNEENETLLKEIHHRVKNNLQMITSLLNMQDRRTGDVKSKEVLAVTKNRVKSIGLIHEHLYRHNDLSKVNLKKYVSDLLKMLVDSLHTDHPIDIQLDIVKKKASMDTAIHIGLILNELITNSIKYAFVDHPSPMLSLKIIENKTALNLILSDNGLNYSSIKKGFGWTIIESTLSSVNGTTKTYYENGMHIKIEIKDYILGPV